MPATLTETAVKFHIGLHAADLEQSVAFYRVLLGVSPAKHLRDYAKFELADPPLVLALVPNPQNPGGTLNHVGLRLPDSASLVAMQRRLEEAGIATQRQEGVECCYARQTKFWVTDPDRTLWELYVFEEDLDHSGFDDAPAPQQTLPKDARVWEHHLMAPVPAQIPHRDASIDEVRLEGTFNAQLDTGVLDRFLGEIHRVLTPGGRVIVHGLVSSRAFPGKPQLPGLASLVQRVPVQNEPVEALRRAGFSSLFFDKLGDIHCFEVGGVELRELRLIGVRPEEAATRGACHVLYKGPFAEVEDDEGNVFPRGKKVAVTARTWHLLQGGKAAGQFLFFPSARDIV